MVVYYEIRPILDRIIKRYIGVQYIRYSDFDQIKEIGCGGYGTVYTARYRGQSHRYIRETVALKRFRNFDKTSELFISEVSTNNW